MSKQQHTESIHALSEMLNKHMTDMEHQCLYQLLLDIATAQTTEKLLDVAMDMSHFIDCVSTRAAKEEDISALAKTAYTQFLRPTRQSFSQVAM